MVARIIVAAIAGWLLGIAPLAVVNTLSLAQGAVDPSATAVAGISALVAGILLGGLAAGLIGGHRGGAIGGAAAGALFTASLVGLELWLQSRGSLPVLVAEHPIRTIGALIFIGVLLAGVALGVAVSLGMRAARSEARAVRAFAAARDAARGDLARSRPMGPPASQPRSAPPGAPPAQQMERDWRVATRPIPPGSDPRAMTTRPAGSSGAWHDERPNQGYDDPRRSREPERW